MDDVLLFTPTKKSHIAILKDSLKVLLKMDLRSHQRNVNYKELQYMGNPIFIKDQWVCIKPLWSRLEAIQNLKSPTDS